MLEGKELLDELYLYAERFEEFMKNKQYSQAKGCYDSVRTTLIVLKADEAMKREFFGERGERCDPERRIVSGKPGTESVL